MPVQSLQERKANTKKQQLMLLGFDVIVGLGPKQTYGSKQAIVLGWQEIIPELLENQKQGALSRLGSCKRACKKMTPVAMLTLGSVKAHWAGAVETNSPLHDIVVIVQLGMGSAFGHLCVAHSTGPFSQINH